MTWTNTRVQAGNKLSMQAGGDMTLKGAVASAQRIEADVGGNLRIESLQDTSHFESKQKSIGGSVTVGAGGGGSFSASKSNVNSDYASVTEQSGLRAGDGGFNVRVKGDTALVGGAITAAQAAVATKRNEFTTGGQLTLRDIQNQSSYSAKSVGVNIGTSKSLDGKLAPSGTGAGLGTDGGSASSVTKAAISGIAGDVDARTGDKEAGIARIFDAQKVQQNIDAQVAITQTFSRLAPKAVADFASQQASSLRAQAKPEPDEQKRLQLLNDAKQWDEGGNYRIAIHTVVGAMGGGTSGAAGAAASSSAASMLNDWQADMQASLVKGGMSSDAAQAAAKGVTALAAAGFGALVGGAQGAATALTVDANNRQLHPTEKARIKQLAGTEAAKEARLTAAACAMVHCYAEYPVGSATYTQLLQLAALGASDDMAAERKQLANQSNMFGYSTSGVFNDANLDALKQVNNTY